MRGRPRVDACLCVTHRSGQESDEDPRDRPSRDVAGSEQNARALVPLRHELLLGQLAVLMRPAKSRVDETTQHSPQEDRRRRRQWKIDTDRKRQRRDTAHLEHDRDHRSEQHEGPRQPSVENPLDDVRHQGCLGSVELGDLRAVRPPRVGAVDPRIDQVDGVARVVHEIAASGPPRIALLVPHPVAARVGARLRPLQGLLVL